MLTLIDLILNGSLLFLWLILIGGILLWIVKIARDERKIDYDQLLEKVYVREESGQNLRKKKSN